MERFLTAALLVGLAAGQQGDLFGLLALLAGKFNSLRQHPHLEARLRQQVSPAEAAVAL